MEEVLALKVAIVGDYSHHVVRGADDCVVQNVVQCVVHSVVASVFAPTSLDCYLSSD